MFGLLHYSYCHSPYRGRFFHQFLEVYLARIKSLFKTYIKGATEKIRKNKGEKDFCLSVFVDNAGAISLNDNYNLVFKVETHNSPSALDPYGGALTGIVVLPKIPQRLFTGTILVLAAVAALVLICSVLCTGG